MEFNKWLWYSLAVFTVHNMEEYFTMQPYIVLARNLMPHFLSQYVQTITNGIFLEMILVIMVVALIMIYAGVKAGPGSRGMLVAMTWISGGLLFNGIHHLEISFILRGYSPGVISSIVLLIPVALYLYYRAYDEKQLGKVKLLWSIIAGAGLMLPVIVGAGVLVHLLA